MKPLFLFGKRVTIVGHKRGRLSRAEDKTIAKLIDEGFSNEQIASQMNRPVTQINVHVKKFYGRGENVSAKAPEIAEFTRLLRNSVHWNKLKEHYNKEDLEYYETIYASLISQFKDDVTAADDLQILQAVDGHMLINQHKKRSKAYNDRLLVIERDLAYMYMDLQHGDDPNLQSSINNLESQRQAISAQIQSGVKVFTELSKKFDDTVGKLKGTRDQRLKNAENSTQSWPALIKTLAEKKVRAKEGEYAAMVKFATDKKTTELQQPYKYINNEIDQPMLVPENVLIETSFEIDDNAFGIDITSPAKLPAAIGDLN